MDLGNLTRLPFFVRLKPQRHAHQVEDRCERGPGCDSCREVARDLNGLDIGSCRGVALLERGRFPRSFQNSQECPNQRQCHRLVGTPLPADQPFQFVSLRKTSVPRQATPLGAMSNL